MHDVIQQLLDQHPVVVFMKGTPTFPQCGFSGHVIEVLKQYPVTLHTVNVLEDPAMREGIKTFGQWPTIPQVYVKGELIGGCDIVAALHEQDQLAAALDGVTEA